VGIEKNGEDYLDKEDNKHRGKFTKDAGID